MKINQSIHKAIIHILFCACTFFFFSFSLFAESPKLIKFAMSDSSPPLSYLESDGPKGMFKDILVLLFSYLPEYKLSLTPAPWPRGQQDVQAGRLDAFFTFPSEGRKTYADFTSEPLHVWDYGNLVYNLKNPNKLKIENAKSFDDLKDLIFVSQEGIDWENENVPKYIKREYVNKLITLLHLVFRRNTGDFFIMSADEAVFYAKKFGYEKRLGMKKVGFIPNGQVKYHIGVSKAYPGKTELLAAIEATMKKPDFQKKKKEIQKKYAKLF